MPHKSQANNIKKDYIPGLIRLPTNIMTISEKKPLEYYMQLIKYHFKNEQTWQISL